MFKSTDVDVIIPCAGSAEYFEVALDSVLSQTYKPENIYVIDNACQHMLYKTIVDKKNDPCVKYIKFDTRVLMTENWQRCLNSGTSSLVAFIHDDDYWFPTYLEFAIAALNENDEASICLNGYVNFQDSPNDVEPLTILECQKNYVQIKSIEEPVRAFFISTCNFSHMSAMVFKRGPIGFSLVSVWMPDQIFLANYLQISKYTVNPEVNALVRQSSNSLTTAYKNYGFMSVETIKHLREQIEFYLRNKKINVFDLVRLFPLNNYSGYYYRVTQACFSWPLRPLLMKFGFALLSARSDNSNGKISLGMRIKAGIWILKCLVADLKYYFKDFRS